MSHVLIALAKWPPSICAQSEVKSRFSLSARGSGCFGAAFWRVFVAGLVDFAGIFEDDFGGMAEVVEVETQAVCGRQCVGLRRI